MKSTQWLLLLSGLFILTTAFQCELDETFDVECVSFSSENLRYFPISVGDTFKYADTSGTLRSFYVADRFVFADTVYQSLNPDERCVHYIEYLINEPADDRTVINLFLNQLLEPEGGLSMGINFSDFGATGSPYFQLVNLEPAVSGGLNTIAMEVDSLVIDDFTYNNVVMAELPQDPDPLNRYFNDVRRLWIAPEGGIIQFEDFGTGIWQLQRPN